VLPTGLYLTSVFLLSRHNQAGSDVFDCFLRIPDLPLDIAMAATQPIYIDNRMETSGVNLVTFDSPNFADDVQALLGSETLAKFSPILPQSVILVNDTNRYVWGFSVIYSYPSSLSASGNPQQYRRNSTAGFRTGRIRALAPGDRYLITPIPGVWSRFKADGKTYYSPAMTYELGNSIETYISDHVSSNEEIHLTLDSVIFEDGEIQGPDTIGRLTALNEQLRAENDLIAKLDGATQQDRMAYLQTMVGSTVVGEYGLYLSSLANHFLTLLNQQDLSEFNAVFSRMKQGPFLNNAAVHRRTE